jgi:cobalt-precorrin-5B (C1)-methyltransferase
VLLEDTVKLREGFTTGSAATSAIVSALNCLYKKNSAFNVKIKTPSGYLNIPINYICYSNKFAISSVIKDGGDDPDCTHGIEIVAMVFRKPDKEILKDANLLNLSQKFHFYSGKGIGIVTKEGLSVKPGEPAINPVPRKMIKDNVERFLELNGIKEKPYILIEVPEGGNVSKKTLNERLGIVGGISILGTTGIVKPVSMDAFTATIDISLSIAKKKGLKQVVLSFGRQSEISAKKILNLPDEAFIIMGDFFRYAINKAKSMGFKIIVAGQPGKILKASMDSENTNVKFGEFSIEKTIIFLSKFCSKDVLKKLSFAKTARHLTEIAEKNKIKLWDNIAMYLSEKENISVFIFSYEGELLGRS